MRSYKFVVAMAAMQLVSLVADAQTSPEKKPNILVIWGDDIGWENVSAYGLSVMGYTTPRIDSIGKGGVIFTIITRSRPAPPGAWHSSPGSIPSARA